MHATSHERSPVTCTIPTLPDQGLDTMRNLFPLLLIAMAALAGCDGGTGTQTEVQSNCSSEGGRGTCSVTLASIKGGTYRYEFSNDEFWPNGRGVDVTARVSVAKGAVKVWLEDPDQKKATLEVEPGETRELNGTAWLDTLGDNRSCYVYFEPLGVGDAKRAENVQAEIRYNMP